MTDIRSNQTPRFDAIRQRVLAVSAGARSLPVIGPSAHVAKPEKSPEDGVVAAGVDVDTSAAAVARKATTDEPQV